MPAGTARAVVITGPPGAGKSTVARLLASRAAGPAVHVIDTRGQTIEETVATVEQAIAGGDFRLD